MTANPTNPEEQLREDIISIKADTMRTATFTLAGVLMSDEVDNLVSFITLHTNRAVAQARIESDRVIFKLLNKLVDEIIEDHDNFSSRDNSATITGRYAMKIKDAVNEQLTQQATREDK